MPSVRTCIILVNYHGSRDTAACVRSLLDSGTALKIVIVDTTPNDSLLEAALEFAPDVVLLRAAANVGFGQGNNIGIQWALERSSFRYVFLLNNDTIVHPDSISVLENEMERQSDVGMMTPRIAYLDHPQRLWYGGGVVDWRRASAFTPGYNGPIDAQLALKERDVSFASGCALFFRAEVLIRLKGFHPSFFMYEEDVELCLRAAELGVRIRYVPTSVILHKAQGSDPNSNGGVQNLWSVSNPRLSFFAYHIIRNRVLNILLHGKGSSLLLALLFFPLFMLRRGLPLVLGRRLDAVGAMGAAVASALRERARAVRIAATGSYYDTAE